MDIGIINYGMGNIASLVNSFEKIGKKARLLKDPCDVKACDKLILPGVGAFGDAAKSLETSGFKAAVIDYVKTGKDLLGICLGMQLLFKNSAECAGSCSGFGFFDGNVLKFSKTPGVKIPHMGWNKISYKSTAAGIFKGLDAPPYLYFVHSYYCPVTEFTVATAFYGKEFSAALQKDNIFGLQPHPEKSHKNGLKILENFCK